MFPLVSIVIPSYKPRHFEQALKTAIGQTYPNIEILVSDNCATEEIHTICARYPQVIYQRNPIKGVANVVASFFTAKGEFVKPLFDDDLLHPFCVERMVAAMLSRADVEMVFSASSVIDAHNLKNEYRRPYEHSGYLDGQSLKRTMLLGFKNVVGECTSILFRRAKLWALGNHHMFSHHGRDFTGGLDDVVFYWNLVQGASAFYIDEELSYFRWDMSLDSNSNSSTNPNFGKIMAGYVDLLLACHDAGEVTADEFRNCLPMVAGLELRCGDLFPEVKHICDEYAQRLANLG